MSNSNIIGNSHQSSWKMIQLCYLVKLMDAFEIQQLWNSNVTFELVSSVFIINLPWTGYSVITTSTQIRDRERDYCKDVLSYEGLLMADQGINCIYICTVHYNTSAYEVEQTLWVRRWWPWKGPLLGYIDKYSELVLMEGTKDLIHITIPSW